MLYAYLPGILQMIGIETPAQQLGYNLGKVSSYT